jgi:uncharacterized repeat protein (TIGR04138 family)
MDDFDKALDPILAKDPRYSRGAYQFLREALDHTQMNLVRSGAKARHVTPTELLEGLRECALKQFGPMALTVLEDWGVRSGEDWGEIVFNLIEQQVLAKTDRDSKEDFRGSYDFHEAFHKPFLPSTRRPVG